MGKCFYFIKSIEIDWKKIVIDKKYRVVNKLKTTAPLRWKCSLSLDIMIQIIQCTKKTTVKFIRNDNGIKVN